MFLRKTKCRNDEKSGRRRKKLLLRPLPLSCLLHLIGLILLGLVLHNNAVQSEEQPPEAEIVMETAEAEMPPEAVPEEQKQDTSSSEQQETPKPASPEPTESPEPQQSPEQSQPAPAAQPAKKAESAKAENKPAKNAEVAKPAKAANTAKPAASSPLPVDSAPATAAHVEGGVPVQTGPAAPSAAGSTAPSAAAGTREGQEAGPSSTADSSRSDNGSAAAAGSSSDSPNSSAGSGSTESDADIASRFAAHVEANKEYPYSAVRLGQTGSVTIWADLSADGALEGCGISSSSGISSLDQSALKAVRASCPFPHGAGHSIHIVETIYFNLNE